MADIAGQTFQAALGMSSEHCRRYYVRPIKGTRRRPFSAKPEAEIWQKPDVSTRNHTLPIRSPYTLSDLSLPFMS